ncbi:MAG: hypothetical protein FWC19_02555 [Treponema sp.]|nr:hypothetical protein [Treponema sp.]
MKTLTVLTLIFIFSGSAACMEFSMQEQYNTDRWFMLPSDNKLIVIGISNPMIKRQDEIISAKEDAARKIAMFFGVHGTVEVTNSIGSNILDYSHESNISLSYDSDYESFIDKLKYDPKDILITAEAVFIRFWFDADIDGINYTADTGVNRPAWTRNQDLPDIPGYVTSVGFARNQRRLKDTIFKSTEDAITRMIADLHTVINTKEISIAGKNSSSYIHTKSEGNINNFHVIELWIDPDTRFVYTLAVARKGI